MSEIRRVVRREPEVNAQSYDEEGDLYWMVQDDGEEWNEYEVSEFHATFIDADLAEDLAWNAVIRQLADRHEAGNGNTPILDEFGNEDNSYTTEEWLLSLLRPIAPAEGEAG